MVIYNEGKVILRCLNSVVHLIDYYVVVDTGSSDSSKKIIKEFFDERNIPGEIYDGEDFNMSKHLNFAFEKLKNKTDFAFYIDADNILSVPENTNIDSLKTQLGLHDAGIVTVENDTIKYGKRLFYKLNKNWKWQGVIHEIATCPQEYTTFTTNLNLIIHNDGNSWTSYTVKEKYLRHTKIILKDIEDNGPSSRNVFYLAQSYRDAGEKEMAIEWYSQRLNMIGFYEELYISQLNIAMLKWELCKPVAEVADEFMKCGELDTLRAEHLFDLKTMYERNNRPNSAVQIGKLLAEYAGKNPYPQRVLFINPEAYLSSVNNSFNNSHLIYP